MLRVRPAILSVLLLALLVLGSAPLMGRAQDEPVELLIWDQFTTPSESDVADAIYASFTAANPNITIRREVFDSDQMRQTINTALSSGTGPDIVFYDAGPGFAGVLADAGLLLPLEDLSAEYGWKDRIAETALQGATIDDQLYGLPLQVDLIGMYINRTLLEQEGLEAPETVEELVTFCQQASERGYVPISFNNNPGWQSGHQFSMTATNMVGPEAMRQLIFENEGSWDTPEMVQAMEAYFVTLRDAGCFAPDVNALTDDDGNALFYSGQSLLNTTGGWIVNDIETNMPDTDVEFVPFPALEGGQGRFWVTGIGSAFFISAQSEHQDAAAQFLDYLFSPEAAEQWVGGAGFVVPVEFDASSLEISPLFRSIVDTLGSAAAGEIELGYNIDVLAPAVYNEAMWNGFQAMLAGDKTAEEQAADLQAAWEEGQAAE